MTGMWKQWMGAIGVVALVGAVSVAADEGKTYGDGVTVKQATAVKALLDTPTAHVGKTVRVDGVVSKVCQAMGCWIEVTDPASGRGVRFKAKDGVIVFPKDAPGRRVSAQGTFEEIATSPVREAHDAQSKSTEHVGHPTSTTAKTDTPAEKLYWVRATGAVLY